MSVKVVVSFYGVIRDLVDSRRVEIQLPAESTVKELLETLCERYGPNFRVKVLSPEGRLQKSVKVVVGSDNIDQEGLSRRLAGEEEAAPEVMVLIIPPVFGGSQLKAHSSKQRAIRA